MFHFTNKKIISTIIAFLICTTVELTIHITVQVALPYLDCYTLPFSIIPQLQLVALHSQIASYKNVTIQRE